MKELEKFNLMELTPYEKNKINGGDKFMYNLGKSLGMIGGWIKNGAIFLFEGSVETANNGVLAFK
jgi:hypothetical protein